MRTNLRVISGDRGAFAYLDALMGAGIVSVVFVSLYLSLSTGFAMMRYDRENLRATQILINRLEGIRLYNWEQLGSGMIPTTFTEEYDPHGEEGAVGTVYTGRVSVTPATLNPKATYSAAAMRQITVAVNWSSGGRQHTRQMSTYVSQFGMQNYVFNN
jgi:hypothetical protein